MGKKHKKHKSDHHSSESSMEKTPLKLVLKLGSEVMYDSDYAANSPASSTHESSRKMKKRKKKRHHDEDFIEPVVTAKILEDTIQDNRLKNVSVPSPPKKMELPPKKIESPKIEKTVEDMEVQTILPPELERPKSSSKPVVKLPLNTTMRKALNKLLEHLLKQLEKKDVHDIFAWPVNDMIAPGYSSVIDTPMDFSTIRNKIETNQYHDVCEFKEDFDLMIDNCCVYNKSDTMYYEIAKKVSAAGMKILSKERLKNTKRALNFLNDLSKHQLETIFGFASLEEEVVDASDDAAAISMSQPLIGDEATEATEDSAEENIVSEELDLRAHPDAISFTDADNEDTVASDAIQAMKNAKKKLKEKCSKSRIGFLRMDKEGKTTLNILNPDVNEESVREVDLGVLTGSVTSGFDVMPEAKEDKRNKVTPLEYLSYGPFGSYAPTYDSRMSNLTQDESDLLLSAYGSDTGLLFAKSMEEFVADSDKSLVQVVGDILDTVTHGARSAALQEIKKRRVKAEVKIKPKKAVTINIDELKSLQEMGINIDFIKEIETKYKQKSGIDILFNW